jgi:hypothetical protein
VLIDPFHVSRSRSRIVEIAAIHSIATALEEHILRLASRLFH